jgi:hypothetical protein
MTTAGNRHPPEHFDEIFLQLNHDGIIPVAVAGQAVNIWGQTLLEWGINF